MRLNKNMHGLPFSIKPVIFTPCGPFASYINLTISLFLQGFLCSPIWPYNKLYIRVSWGLSVLRNKKLPCLNRRLVISRWFVTRVQSQALLYTARSLLYQFLLCPSLPCVNTLIRLRVVYRLWRRGSYILVMYVKIISCKFTGYLLYSVLPKY